MAKEYPEDPAELLSIFALRFSRVKLAVRQWDHHQNGGNLCHLNIVRNGIPLQIDSVLPNFDIRRLDIDLESTGEIGADEGLLSFLSKRIVDRVNEFLNGYEFNMVLERPEPVRFSLEPVVGGLPVGLYIPRICEGSWRCFLSDGSPEQKAYLAAYRLRQEREKDTSKLSEVLAELTEALQNLTPASTEA